MSKTNMEKSWVILFIAVFVLTFFSPFKVLADSHTMTMVSTLTVPAEGKTTIKHVFSSVNSQSSPIPASVTINKVGNNLSSLSAKSESGTKLAVTEDKNQPVILVSIPKENQKQTGAWSFTVSYKTDLISSIGLIKVIALPRLTTNLDVTTETVTVAADLDLGFASVSGPTPDSTRIGIGEQLLTFKNASGALSKSALIMFGDTTFAELTINASLKNDSWWWKDVSLTLPPDTNQQLTRLQSIEPAPKNIRLDKDGNMLATYRLRPKQSIDITAKVLLDIKAQTYKFNDQQSIESTDATLVERYTRPTDVWQPVTGIDYTSDKNSVASEVVKAVFNGVVAKIKQESTVDTRHLSLIERNAALKYSDWLVGELRSRGMPARVALGLLMSDGDRISGKSRQHAWVEAYVAGTGWVTLDPWLGSFSDAFGSGDPLHVALGLWGLETDKPPVLLDATSIEYLTQAPEEKNQTELSLSAVNYVWFPFVSVLSAKTQLPIGHIVDDMVMNLADNEYTLGSLSPLQKVVKRKFKIGSDAFKSDNVELYSSGQTDDGLFIQVQSQVSYLPLIIEGSLAVLAGLFIFWQKRRSPRKERVRTSKESLTLHNEAVGGDIELENLIGPLKPSNIDPNEPNVSDVASVVSNPQPELQTSGQVTTTGGNKPVQNGTITSSHIKKRPPNFLIQ
jgi:hypothetical protein